MAEETQLIKAVVVYVIKDGQMLTILGKKSYEPFDNNRNVEFNKKY